MFEALIAGVQNQGISFDVIDLQNRSVGRIGSFNLSRAMSVIHAILLSWSKIPTSNSVYLILSLSPFGFIRDFLIIWWAFLLKKRMIVHVRGGGYEIFYSAQSKFVQWIIRNTLSRVDKIIVLSESLRFQFSFFPPLFQKTVVVPNGVKRPEKNSIGIKRYHPDEPFRILYLSNLIISKGYFDILLACQSLIQSGISNFQCNFCGEFLSISNEVDACDEKSQKEYFLKCIEDWGLKNNVFYHGSVTGSKKHEFLQNSHVFILPTHYLWEGQPVSILESFSYGLPVISTPYRAIPDQLINNFNGIFVDYGAPDQIVDAINKLKNNSEFYIALSQNAKLFYEQNFTLEKHIHNMLSILISNDDRIIG